MKNFGFFNESGDEYTITEKKLPKHWDNYLWNNNFFCRLTEDGAGESLYKHQGGLRTHLNKDRRIIYLRDEVSGEIWELPGKGEKDKTTYGMGYGQYYAVHKKIESTLTITVPDDFTGEGWKITVTNRSEKEIKLSLFSYIKLDLTGYPTPFVVQCYNNTFNKELNALLFENKDAYCPTTHFNAFLASDTEITSVETVGELFSEQNKRCTNTLYQGGGGNNIVNDLIGVLHFTMTIKPAASQTVQILTGIYEEISEIKKAVSSYLIKDGLDRAMQTNNEKSKKFMENFSIKTPDNELDRLSNNWIKHNLRFVTQWTRIYSRGFRDCLQDTMGVASLDAAAARTNILTAMRYVFNSGMCKRAWDNVANTLSNEHYADGPIWIPMTINEYIRETGDLAILDEKVTYFDGGEGTVMEHMLKAALFLYNDRGEHGLCLIHDGDWCDTAHLLGKKGRGEGVWLTIALYNALIEISELAKFLKNDKLLNDMHQKALEVREKVDKAGWDGEWFIIAYNDKGEKVGSAANKEGKIFLNPQSWAVLSGITTKEREESCLKTIDLKLDSDIGPLLLTPPFTAENKDIGSLTSFAAGTIENGSCYCHAASFKIVADCKRGRGNKAYETLRKIIPGGDADQKNEKADCPPYAFTNSRFALFHPYLGGRCLGTWNTGTISWCWQAITEWILGIRKTFEGITINPCIPSKWNGFTVTRKYRYTTYEIEVENPDHIETGVAKMYVNGNIFNGKLLPITPGETYKVKVIMGVAK